MKLNRYIKISALALAVAMTACGVEEPVRIAPVEQEKVSSLTEGAVAVSFLFVLMQKSATSLTRLV